MPEATNIQGSTAWGKMFLSQEAETAEGPPDPGPKAW